MEAFRDYLVNGITCKFVITTFIQQCVLVHVGLENITMGCLGLMQINT